MVEDAKQETIEQGVQSSSDIVDAAFDKMDEESTSSDSSAEEKTEDETTETEDSSAEDEKTEKSEEKEAEVPKEFHKHPAWQRILKERDEARQKAEGTQNKYSDFESKLEEFNKVTSSPAYVKFQMEQQGYKQEAIDNKLRELGHNVETPQTDDVSLVLRELNIKKEDLNEEGRNYINTYVSDAAKVADIIVRDRLSKILPTELQDIKSTLGKMNNETKATQYTNQMRSLIESEGVLDFSKDVEPALMKYMDENPKASQEEVYEQFKDISRQLTISVLSAKGKKEARNKSKESLRQNNEGVTIDPNKVPTREEGDTDSSFIDKVLDGFGVKY